MPEQTTSPLKIGIVTGLSGEAYAESSSGVRSLASGSPVYQGEELVTAANGNVEIRLFDDTLLSQGENSRISLDDYVYDESSGVGDFLASITQGTFRMVTGKIAEQNPERFKVGTPLATIGIRGTIILSDVGPDGEKHGVEEIHAGKAMLLQSISTGEMLQLFSGQMVDVSSSGLLSSVRPLSTQELQNFREIAPANIRQEQEIREQQNDEQDNDDQTEEPTKEDGQQEKLSDDVTPGGGDELMPDGLFEDGIIEGGGNPLEQPVEPKSEKDNEKDSGNKITIDPNSAPDKQKNDAPNTNNGEITSLVEGTDETNDDNSGGTDQPESDPHNITGSGLIEGTSEADTITGSSSNDTIRGLGSNDTLYGQAGNDELNGGLGDDSLDGGSGLDFITYVDATGSVTVCLTDGTSSGADGSDSLLNIEGVFGAASGDSIYGNSAANTLYGKDGADTLSGYGGSDILIGGRGNDDLDGGTGSASDVDFASYAEADGSVSVSLTSGSTSGADGEDTLSNIEGIIGSNHDDTLDGDNAANTLLGNGGNDTIIGREGDDLLDGGAGVDYVSYAGAGASVSVDLLNGTTSGAHGQDTIENVEGIIGSAHGDTLTGDNVGNTICGNAGDDVISGNGGIDTVSYANASATVTVDLANNSATGADGNDTLSSIENVIGSSHADNITGDMNNNTFINTDSADDVYSGGLGVDTVDYSGMGAGISALFDQGKVDYGMMNFDTITSIEIVIGTQYDDSFQIGDSSATMHTGEGTDHMHCASLSTGVTINNSTGAANSGAYTYGFSGIDDFFASGHVDTFIGNTSGAETIDCGEGSDTFTLHASAATTIKYGSLYSNADTISNFNSGEDNFLFTDMMAFDNTSGFKADGTISGSRSAYFVYENNKFYYDADGDGAGAQQLIADISGDDVQQSDINFSW